MIEQSRQLPLQSGDLVGGQLEPSELGDVADLVERDAFGGRSHLGGHGFQGEGDGPLLDLMGVVVEGGDVIAVLEVDALDGAACGPPLSPAPCTLSRAWTWRPAPNVELSVAGGCIGRDPRARCALGVSRMVGDRAETLAQIDTGREIPEVVLVEGLDRRIRVRGADMRGQFFREVVFSYGRIEVKEVH